MLIIGGFPAFFGWILIVFSVYIVNNIQGFIAILLTGRLLTGVAAGMSAGGVAVRVVDTLYTTSPLHSSIIVSTSVFGYFFEVVRTF